MKRLLSILLLSSGLLLTWLLLDGTWQIGQIIIGLMLAMLVLLLTARARPAKIYLPRVWPMTFLITHVMLDIVRANWEVAHVILGSQRRRSNSGYLQIPLELRDPYGLAMLACIITATPGTVWAGLSPDGAMLTVHVLDLHDEERWIRTIKDRYEAPLKEIFE